MVAQTKLLVAGKTTTRQSPHSFDKGDGVAGVRLEDAVDVEVDPPGLAMPVLLKLGGLTSTSAVEGVKAQQVHWPAHVCAMTPRSNRQ